jgi:hypothetical protein
MGICVGAVTQRRLELTFRPSGQTQRRQTQREKI